jgi:hypothetical protein
VPKARFIAEGDFILHAPSVRFIATKKERPSNDGLSFLASCTDLDIGKIT